MVTPLVEAELLDLDEAGELDIEIEEVADIDPRPVIRHRMSYNAPTVTIDRAPASMRVSLRSDEIDDSYGFAFDARTILHTFLVLAAIGAIAVWMLG